MGMIVVLNIGHYNIDAMQQDFDFLIEFCRTQEKAHNACHLQRMPCKVTHRVATLGTKWDPNTSIALPSL